MKKKYFLLLLFFVQAFFLHAQSYKKLHNKSLVIDTHNDIPSTAIEKK